MEELFGNDPMKKSRRRTEKGKSGHLLVAEVGSLVRTFPTISLTEIRRAFESIAGQYPPILSLKQAAELAGVAQGTLKRHVSEGGYKDCVCRGRPLRFWRDRFAQSVMKDKKRRGP